MLKVRTELNIHLICTKEGSDSCMLWFVTQLIDDYPSDANVKELVDKYDWYLLPVVNPDGYSYTWTTVTKQVLSSKVVNIKMLKHYGTKNYVVIW